MVFVADAIPKELRTIVVFLNEQMRQAEVLAIEIQQYVSDTGLRTLVPQTVGATERARVAKAAQMEKPPITLDQWLTQLEENHETEIRRAANKVISWMQSKGAELGPTKSQDAIYFKFKAADGKYAWPFFIRSSGRLEIAFVYLKHRPRLAQDDARRVFMEKFKAIPDLMLSTENIQGWPAVNLTVMLNDETFRQYTQIADELIKEAIHGS